MGLGFNGGELLLLAIGGCYSNDLFREAAKRGIEVKACGSLSPQIGAAIRFALITYSVNWSLARRTAIDDLIRHTDKVAEIPNSLRYGAEVRLIKV
jgi:putative redox protein